MSGTLDEYRSITSDINSSTWASRLRALFAFMTLHHIRYQLLNMGQSLESLICLHDYSSQSGLAMDTKEHRHVVLFRARTSLWTLAVYHQNGQPILGGIVNKQSL